MAPARAVMGPAHEEGGTGPSRHRWTGLPALVALLLVLLAACDGFSSVGSGADGPGPSGATLTQGTTTQEPVATSTAPSPTTEAAPAPPVTEAAPSPSVTEQASQATEESVGPEPPAAGGAPGVSIALPGLPVGAGSAVDLGDSWCGVFFWQEGPPPGVELRISAVVAVSEGASIRDGGCEGARPCPGTTISLSTPDQGCGVTIEPPSPDAASVTVRLDGMVHCVDVSTCEGLVLDSGATATLERPDNLLPDHPLPVPDTGEPGSPGLPDDGGATAEPGG